MGHDRDEVLKDLRKYVIEITSKNNMSRCTLRMDLLPKNYNLDEETKYHSDNKEYIVAWDVRNNCWKKFNISEIDYCQIIDNY